MTAFAQEPPWGVTLMDTAGKQIAPDGWIHDAEIKLLVQGTPFDARTIDIDEDPAFGNPTTWDFTNPSGPPLIRTFEAPTTSDPLRYVAIHPDGQTIAAVNHLFSGKIFFWDTATGRKIDEINVPSWASYATNMDFVSGGSKIMVWSVSYGGYILFYDFPRVDFPFQPTSLYIRDAVINAVIPSPDGTKFLVSLYVENPDIPSQKKTILRLYDVETYEILLTYGDSESAQGLTEPIYLLSFNGDGTQFVTDSSDSTIRLWDVESGRMLKSFNRNYPGIYDMDFSPDGKSILLAREDYYGNPIAQIIDIATWQVIQTMEGHTDDIVSLSFSPDGLEVLTASRDETARLWDTQTGQLIQICEGHGEHSYNPGYIHDAAFSPDGLGFATASRDSTVKLWRGRPKYDYSIRNTADGPHTLYVRLRDDHGNSETVSYDFNLNLTSARADWSARLQDPEGDTRPEGNWVNRTQMQVVVDGATIDAEEADFALNPEFTDAVTQSLAETFFSSVEKISYPVWNYDGKLVSADWTKLADYRSTAIRVCDFAGNWILWAKALPGEKIRMVSFSPDASRLIVGLEDRPAMLWNADTGELLDGEYLGIIAVAAWSADGSQVLYAGEDNNVRLANAQSGDLLHTFTGHTNTVTSLALSPDGTLALSGGKDGRVMLWDTQTGGLVRTMTSNSINSVAFSPDGASYLAGGNSPYAYLWDVRTGEEIQSFDPHLVSVESVSFSPDGTKVLTFFSRYLRVWDARTGQTYGARKFPKNSISFSPDGTRVFDDNTETFIFNQKYPISLDGLADGAYTLHVRLRNRFGLNQINSVPINLDSVPPSKPGTPFTGSDPVPGRQIQFTWTPSTDNASGIHFYDYQVGTAPGAVDVHEGRVGPVNSIILSVPYGVPVYCRVRAIDKAGNVGEWSEPSAGAIVTTGPNLPGIALDPPYPRAIDDVTARLIGSPYGRYRIEWYLRRPGPYDLYDLMFTGVRLKSSFLTKGDIWRCKISVQIPDGNFKYIYSKTFTVRNTPPSQPLVELSPRPAAAGQPLAVTLIRPSIDPDGDEIAYDIQWRQSTGGGRNWSTRADLAGLSEIPGGEVNDGDLWRVLYTPYESTSPAGPDRVEGLPGRDQVAVGGNRPPNFAFTGFQLVNVSGGVSLGAQWTASDPEGEAVSVDLYYYDERYAMLTPLELGIPAGQNAFNAVMPLPRNAPLRLFAIATDATGQVTHVSSASLTLESAARPAWVLYQ